MKGTTLIRITMLAGLIAAATAPVLQDAGSAQPYPPAKREAIVETIQGTEVSDPYRWMEDTGSTELERWISAQNALTTARIPRREYESARARILELANYDLGYAGRLRGNRLFYLQRAQGANGVSLRVKAQNRSRTLLDSASIPDTDFAESHLGGLNFAPSLWPDRTGDMVAYAYSDGAERARIRVIDTATGLHLPDVIGEIGIVPGFDWNATGDGFYYYRSRLEVSVGATETKRVPAGLWFHRLGTDQDDDIEVISAADGDRRSYVPAVTKSGDWLVVSVREGAAAATSIRVFDTDDPMAGSIHLFDDAGARFIYLGSDGSTLYFQTNHMVPNGRVIAVDLNRPEAYREVVAETDLPMLAGSNVGGDVLGYANGIFVLGYLRDGLADIRLYDDKGQHLHSLALPEGSSIWGSLDGVPGESRLTFSLLNPFVPVHIVSVDTRSGQVRDELRAGVPVDPHDFVVKRVIYQSRDDTRVPMSVVHRRDLELDGTSPALVYGYGMHRWVSLLFYQAHIVHWLELGGVYAMPAIRGGGEYGDAWHDAGIKTNRQNAVDDFVAAGEWLIENNYTSADRIAANGSSASGALAGIIPVRHGDVFAAATIDYPIADLVRAPLYGNGAQLVEEYGSINDPVEGPALIYQSPYHQLRGHSCRMPTLLLVGENDKVALPLHGYKLAARLQELQDCDNPILLYRMADTGHNYGLSADLFAHNTALQVAFLRAVLAPDGQQ